jgi:hypothetical protein
MTDVKSFIGSELYKFVVWDKKTTPNISAVRIEPIEKSLAFDRVLTLKSIKSLLKDKGFDASMKDDSGSSVGAVFVKSGDSILKIYAKGKSTAARGNEDAVNSFLKKKKPKIKMPNGRTLEVEKVLGGVSEGEKASSHSLKDITIKFTNGAVIDFSIKQAGQYSLMNHKDREYIYDFFKENSGSDKEAKKRMAEIDSKYIETISNGKTTKQTPITGNTMIVDAEREFPLLLSAASYRKRGAQKIRYIISAPKNITSAEDIKVYDVNSKSFIDYLSDVKVSYQLRTYKAQTYPRNFASMLQTRYKSEDKEVCLDKYVRDFVKTFKTSGFVDPQLFPKWVYNGDQAPYQLMGFSYHVDEK